MVMNDSRVLFGKWYSLEADYDDPHFLILELERHSPMPEEFIKLRNDMFAGKNVRITVEVIDGYDKEEKWKERAKEK